MTRTERQKEVLKRWVANNCRGAAVLPTGFGKTFTAIMGIQLLLQKFADLKTIVVVPTDLLKQQWEGKLKEKNISNAEVWVINSAIKHQLKCDLLILDECHRFAAKSFIKIFSCCQYRFVLGLTATMERLDERHLILETVCPVVDKVTAVEAVAQGWLSEYKEYKVVLHVKDLDNYAALNKEFNEHFEYFGYDFSLAMSMTGPAGYKRRIAYRDLLLKMNKSLNSSTVYKEITYHATGLMRTMQARKQFINAHPDKIRLTEAIINARKNSKIITFSSTLAVAKQIPIGKTYSGMNTKKQGETVLNEFRQAQSGVLNTIKKANEGLDLSGLNCAIILGQDSSKTTFIQRLGRCLRKEGDKVAEIFTFVIEDTVEETWFSKSHAGNKYEVIDEENLMKVLEGAPYQQYTKPEKSFVFRF